MNSGTVVEVVVVSGIEVVVVVVLAVVVVVSGGVLVLSGAGLVATVVGGTVVTGADVVKAQLQIVSVGSLRGESARPVFVERSFERIGNRVLGRLDPW